MRRSSMGEPGRRGRGAARGVAGRGGGGMTGEPPAGRRDPTDADPGIEAIRLSQPRYGLPGARGRGRAGLRRPHRRVNAQAVDFGDGGPNGPPLIPGCWQAGPQGAEHGKHRENCWRHLAVVVGHHVGRGWCVETDEPGHLDVHPRFVLDLPQNRVLDPLPPPRGLLREAPTGRCRRGAPAGGGRRPQRSRSRTGTAALAFRGVGVVEVVLAHGYEVASISRLAEWHRGCPKPPRKLFR